MRLSSLEVRLGALVGSALLPAADPQVLGGLRRGADLGRLFAQQVADAVPLTAIGLRLALLMVWLAPLWHEGRWATLRSLSATEREALLEALLKHDAYAVRQLVSLLKLFYCMAYLGDVAVLTYLDAYDLKPARPALLQPGRRP